MLGQRLYCRIVKQVYDCNVALENFLQPVIVKRLVEAGDCSTFERLSVRNGIIHRCNEDDWRRVPFRHKQVLKLEPAHSVEMEIEHDAVTGDADAEILLRGRESPGAEPPKAYEPADRFAERRIVVDHHDEWLGPIFRCRPR